MGNSSGAAAAKAEQSPSKKPATAINQLLHAIIKIYVTTSIAHELPAAAAEPEEEDSPTTASTHFSFHFQSDRKLCPRRERGN